MKSVLLVIVLVSLLTVAQAAISLHPRFRKLDVNAKAVPGSYIVVLNQSAHLGVLGRLASRYAAEHVYDIETFKGFSAKLTDRLLSALLDEEFIAWVEPDQIMTVFAGKSTPCDQVQRGAPWGLDRVTAPGPNEVNNNLNYKLRDGEGVDVYVIDTGILVTHVEFATATGGSRAIWGYNAVAGSSNTDKNGHGTHVSSTAVGNTYGFAKKALVYAVKVLGDSGSGTNAGVIAGVNWAADQAATSGRPSVGNMSLGGGISAALDTAVAGAISKGLKMVVAAGNDNKNACLNSPARAATAITVGATQLSMSGERQIDQRSSFSNYGGCVNIFAPGSAILGAWYDCDTCTRTISGTSMASPHVCGIVADILSEQPNATQAVVLETLQDWSQQNIIELNCANNTVCADSPNMFLHRPDCSFY